jgi:hypothetical protein
VRVVDVAENDRALLGRHPAGEAPPDRDANALLDLLLDPHRGTRDQLVRAFVEQQHGAGVGREDRADAGQQHLEQLLELEVGQRRVRDRLDVLEPLARGAFGRECAGVLDRERGAVGGELQELRVGRRELARPQRADVEDADRLPADEQRHAQERLDPLLAQDRVEDVRVVDVAENDRALLGGHAAGEATPDGDADALLDLLLDADGRARDELVRLLVEQQHRAGVGVQQLAHAHEQRRQQLLEVEVREGRVGECLQPLQTVRRDDHSSRHDPIVETPRCLRRLRRSAVASSAWATAI